MRRTTFFLFTLAFMIGCTTKIHYPETRKSNTKDSYFGKEVSDPYRWLEDDQSEETAEWVMVQNHITSSYIDHLPNHNKIKERLSELWNYPTKGVPKKKAGRYFFFANNGLQNQDVLFITDDLNKEAEVLLDPNNFSSDGTIALSKISISNDGKYLGCLVSKSGSDWNQIFVMDIEKKELLPDHLHWIKFSHLSWFGNGFFYCAYEQPGKGAELSAANNFQKVYYHQLGDKQENDQLIFIENDNQKKLYDASVTNDDHFLIISKRGNTKGNAIEISDLSKKNNNFVSIISDYDHKFIPVTNIADDIFFLTNYKAPKYRLIKINVHKIDEDYWEEVIPEKDNVLTSVKIYANKIVTSYMVNACSKIEIYSLKGQFENEIDLPGLGTVEVIKGNLNDTIAFYDYQSFDRPTEVYMYNFSSKKSSLFFKPEVKMDSSGLEVNQVFYKSKDGTTISMFLFHKNNIKLNKKNPVLLYGYGGFDISRTPEFEKAWLVFVEQGGIFVVANLRGGGEYGEEWHQAGTKMKKQNVFDDFIAAAEYLINQKYTCPKKLAIYGRSNGGLLIGAVVNQRPDLFKVAIPVVGVMDMLRYQKFTIGWSWASDYGTSDDSKEMFEYLYHYSPYHNVKEGTKYPAILASTGDHDDRVVPAHTFKYIARMQELNKGSLPTLVRIDSDAGHGSGKPVSKLIDEWADKWTFMFYHLGIKM